IRVGDLAVPGTKLTHTDLRFITVEPHGYKGFWFGMKWDGKVAVDGGYGADRETLTAYAASADKAPVLRPTPWVHCRSGSGMRRSPCPSARRGTFSSASATRGRVRTRSAPSARTTWSRARTCWSPRSSRGTGTARSYAARPRSGSTAEGSSTTTRYESPNRRC